MTQDPLQGHLKSNGRTDECALGVLMFPQVSSFSYYLPYGESDHADRSGFDCVSLLVAPSFFPCQAGSEIYESGNRDIIVAMSLDNHVPYLVMMLYFQRIVSCSIRCYLKNCFRVNYYGSSILTNDIERLPAGILCSGEAYPKW